MEKEYEGIVHKVKEGDTLYRLSKLYGVRLVDIMKENPYVNVYNLQIGDEILIPTHMYEEKERAYYTTEKGDSIGKLMEKCDCKLDELFKNNSMLYDVSLPAGLIIQKPIS